MENETFHKRNLSHLDFVPAENDHSLKTEHLPMKPLQNFANSSFQTLMAQNEDLVAQLRVTLNRLSAIEQLNQQLQENFDATRTQNSAVFDQLLIWKEKSKIWKEREQNLERTHHQEVKRFTIEIDVLQQKVSQLEQCQDDLQRYQKYHEKVKTSVKPYIQKLKNYAKSLFEQTQTLNSQLIEKDLKIDLLETQIQKLSEQYTKREETSQAQKNELIIMFEEERNDLKRELGHLQNSNEVLVEKTRSLDRSLERQDELENLIVALRRSKEESLASRHAELAMLKTNHSKLSQDFKTIEMKNQDLENEVKQLHDQLLTAESKNSDCSEQLSSLRYLWNQKSQENEKLKMTLSGLEKINLDLSQKLKKLRDQTPEASV